ncbi:MAG: carbonic anhydrase [Alphaproteobacteria bacterium]|nr:MAG: carbonic anhydrase [Alphaproteobacteria bacterium]
MALPDSLIDGYRRFRQGAFAEQQQRYERLAAQGQQPATLVIACCDSRVDPAAIFDAGPGELFVIRNVANLVPPYAPDGDFHGTSAGIEFAVTGLGVRHILVMGHAQCGGITAALTRDLAAGHAGSFVTKWMSIAAAAKAAVLAGCPPPARQQALEEAAIRASLDNLMTFPYVAQGVAAGTLALHGAHFGIKDGHLSVLDARNRAFKPAIQ